MLGSVQFVPASSNAISVGEPYVAHEAFKRECVDD